MKNVDTSSWKEFKLSELFDISTTRAIDRKNVIFTNEGAYDFIGRTSVGYGIQGRVDRLTYAPNPANTFSLVQVGETCCLFREREWYASQNIFMLAPKDKHLCDVQLFLTAVINKKLEPYKAAYTYPTLKVLQDLTILLPFKEIEEIDFEYMEARIRELEEARIKELEIERIREKKEALRVMGLHDTKLTESEEKALKHTPQTKEFLLTDLFGAPTRGTRLVKSQRKPGNIPLITAGFQNNGVAELISNKNQQDFVNALTIDMFGNCFYRDYTFKADDNILVFFNAVWDNLVHLYLCTCINKSVTGYDYGKQYRLKSYEKTKIKVPVTDTDELDVHYVQDYVRALQKLTIQKLYDDKGIFIDKAKEVCS